jgi:predicted NUDIX family NTP pyrophosphohydrolase
LPTEVKSAKVGTGVRRNDVVKESAGLLMFRRGGEGIEVLLGHPGGPFWATRHEGAWTIPKGGPDPGEALLDTAIREFREETSFEPCGPYLPLGQITQRSGKIVHAWAFEGDCDPAGLVSVTVETEWPPRSGRRLVIPEIDQVRFFGLDEARAVINLAQVALLDRLLMLISTSGA